MKNNIKKRVSNRRYPPQNCNKPDCMQEFIPTDARQLYCCEQHRIDYNNDKRKLLVKMDADFIKAVKKNSNIMCKILESPFYQKDNHVHKSLLDYEGYNFGTYHKMQINNKSKKEVYVCHNFGIELINSSKKLYSINKL